MDKPLAPLHRAWLQPKQEAQPRASVTISLGQRKGHRESVRSKLKLFSMSAHKTNGRFFFLRFEKIWLIFHHSVISIVNLVPGLIPIPDKSRNTRIPQVAAGLRSFSGQVEAEVEGISHEFSTPFLKVCLYS